MKKSVGEYYERLPYFRVCESYDGVLVTTPETAALVAIQKDSLFLEHLNASDALGIGHAILELANEWCPGRPVAVHIENDHHPLFVHFMDGTGVGNADWINKKRMLPDILDKVHGVYGWSILNGVSTLQPRPAFPPTISVQKVVLYRFRLSAKDASVHWSSRDLMVSRITLSLLGDFNAG